MRKKLRQISIFSDEAHFMNLTTIEDLSLSLKQQLFPQLLDEANQLRYQPHQKKGYYKLQIKEFLTNLVDRANTVLKTTKDLESKVTVERSTIISALMTISKPQIIDEEHRRQIRLLIDSLTLTEEAIRRELMQTEIVIFNLTQTIMKKKTVAVRIARFFLKLLSSGPVKVTEVDIIEAPPDSSKATSTSHKESSLLVFIVFKMLKEHLCRYVKCESDIIKHLKKEIMKEFKNKLINALSQDEE
ncbi:MAG: hypothetical protein Q9191_008445, partial [Dirinaria sp. TL-2023a]